jgi:NAD-dependent deacetylase sirtuin 2
MARFKELLSLRAGGAPSTAPPPSPLLPSLDLPGVASLIASGRAKRVVFMCGAGISVNAGIPDFRSPGTGLYSRLEDYGLPHPQAVFEIDFFRRNPRPFFLLAKELFPGTYAPTATHHFMRLLHDKGLLLRCYSQNIDSLERMAGLPPTAVVAAHGNFDSARCIDCRVVHEVDYVREAVMAQTPCRCAAGGPGCGGLVKPDIVFFGESLPKRFWSCMAEDLPQADLLIVAGTSLVVQPFASLVDRVPVHCPRLLINRERVGEVDPALRGMGYDKGFNFGEGAYRDVVFEGDCDDGVWALAEALGWAEELRELVEGWKAPEGTPGPKQKSGGVDEGIAAAAAAAAEKEVKAPVE